MNETRDTSVLTSAAALVDVGRLEIVSATGDDRIKFLHRLLTANIEQLGPGEGTRALLLDLKGHIVSDLVVLVHADRVSLVTWQGQGATAAAALNRYAVMDDFQATLGPSWQVCGLYGLQAGDRWRETGMGLLPPGDRWAHQTATGEGGETLWVVHVPAYGVDGWWIWGDPAALLAAQGRLSSLGVPHLNTEVAEALRIHHGEPRPGSEITGDHFPMEVGRGPAIDYNKGCYLGQEPIVRIRDRGHINWRLVRLRIEGKELPAVGARLESDSKPKAGRVTSVARLPASLGGGIEALALLHVSVPDGAEVAVDGPGLPLRGVAQACSEG